MPCNPATAPPPSTASLPRCTLGIWAPGGWTVHRQRRTSGACLGKTLASNPAPGAHERRDAGAGSDHDDGACQGCRRTEHATPGVRGERHRGGKASCREHARTHVHTCKEHHPRRSALLADHPTQARCWPNPPPSSVVGRGVSTLPSHARMHASPSTSTAAAPSEVDGQLDGGAGWGAGGFQQRLCQGPQPRRRHALVHGTGLALVLHHGQRHRGLHGFDPGNGHVTSRRLLLKKNESTTSSAGTSHAQSA